MDHNLNQPASPPAPTGKNHDQGAVPKLSKSGLCMLSVFSIRIDGGTQSRAKIDQATIDDYAEAMSERTTFPPIVVYNDGRTFWLADGFHRYFAAGKAGLKEIGADVKQGTQRDAVLYSLGANAEHGLRRSNDDKRRAVLTLLDDPEWAEWSDREIARRCHVSAPFVAKCRPTPADLTVNVGSESEEAPWEGAFRKYKNAFRKYTDKHGNEATMAVAQIGKPKRGDAPPSQASTSDRRRVQRKIAPEFRQDPAFQEDAEAAARDIELDREERIGLSGATELAAENDRLRKENSQLTRRIGVLLIENAALKSKSKYFKREAEARGWKPSRKEAADA